MSKTFLKLVRTEMRKLKSGERLSEHGIIFERLPDGDGVFSVNIMVDGVRVHRVVGRESDRTTRTQAEEYVEKIRQDAKQNRLSLPKGRKTALGFRQASTQYIAQLKQEGGKDITAKERQLKLHLVPFFADTPLSKICGFDIERYKKQRGEEERVFKGERTDKNGKTIPVVIRHATKGTINRELAVLSHLLNKAIEWNWIDRRPAKIRRYKEDQGRIVYLTAEQAERLKEAATHDQNLQITPFIMIGLETGMRLSEILSIRGERVDTKRRIIYIPIAKAGAREQPITQHLAKYLETYMASLTYPSGWLFPSVGSKTGHTINVRKPFRRVVIAAGLDPDVILRHTLRHTTITHLVQSGIDLPTVKRISGHKTLAMVERYAHQNGAHIQAAMDKLEKCYRLSSGA